MDCRECGEELGAYLDSELAGGARAAVEGHLKDCAVCRSELDALRRLEAVLAASRLPAPDDGIRDAGVRRVMSEAPSRALRPPVGFFRAAAAVFLLACAFMLYTAWGMLSGIENRACRASLTDLLRRYAAASPDQKRAIESSIGEERIPDLILALDAPDLKVQIGASQILTRYRNEKVAGLILEHAKQKGLLDRPEWVLGDIGEESGDADLVPLLYDIAAGDRSDRVFAVAALRALLKEGSLTPEQARALKQRGLAVPGTAAGGRERIRTLLLARLASPDEASRRRAVQIASALIGTDASAAPEEVRAKLQSLERKAY